MWSENTLRESHSNHITKIGDFMNRTFIKELLMLENATLVERALCDRRDKILTAIAAGTIDAQSDVIKELCELNIALGDVPEVRDES
jgi:hypothetical protein